MDVYSPLCPKVSEALGASRDNDSSLITVKCYWTGNKKYSPPQNNMIRQAAFLPITSHSRKRDLSSFSNRNGPLQNVCRQAWGAGNTDGLCSRIPQHGLCWAAVFSPPRSKTSLLFAGDESGLCASDYGLYHLHFYSLNPSYIHQSTYSLGPLRHSQGSL